MYLNVSHESLCQPCGGDSAAAVAYVVLLFSHCVQLFATPRAVARQFCLWDFPGKSTGVGC